VEADGRVTIVRDLYDAWVEGGVEAMLAHVEPDVDWVPYDGRGEVLHGSDELRAYWADVSARGERQEATLYGVEEIGDAVLLTGSLRVTHAGRLTESQLAWVYAFEGERLRTVTSYGSRTEALRAMSAFA